jgi:hypothetical protein
VSAGRTKVTERVFESVSKHGGQSPRKWTQNIQEDLKDEGVIRRDEKISNNDYDTNSVCVKDTPINQIGI